MKEKVISTRIKIILGIIMLGLVAVIFYQSYAIFKESRKLRFIWGVVEDFEQTPDIIINVFIDKEKSSDGKFPSKTTHRFKEMSCTNSGNAEFNEDKRQMAIKNITEPTECDIHFVILDNLMASIVEPTETSVFLGGPITRDKIESIVFTDTNEVPAGVKGSFDVSEHQSGEVMAWYTDTNSNNMYEVTIGQVGGVKANANSSYLFRNIRNLNILNLNNLDTSSVTNMQAMFASTGYNSQNFTLNLGTKFDTSNVTNMFDMFHYTGRNSTIFTLELGDKFDTSQVTNMSAMFRGTGYQSTNFTLNLGSKFDTSKVINMSYMFNEAGYINKNFTLNLGSNFDTSKVTNMTFMFHYTGRNSTIFTLNLGNKFDTSQVTNMGAMFFTVGHSNPNFTLNLGSKFNTSKVTNMNNMFDGTGTANPNFVLNMKTMTFGSVTNSTGMFAAVQPTSTIYVKDTTAKAFVSSRFSGANIIDCSSNTCP